jgi:lipopolysaccharide transport system ATP-binding protein
MQALSTMTTRCVLLRKGRNVLEGPPAKVIAGYLEEGSNGERLYSAPPSETAPSITRVEVQTSEPNNTHVHGKRVRFMFDVTVPVPMPAGVISFQIVDSRLQPVVQMWVFDAEQPFLRQAGTYRLTCEIPRLRLYLGRYTTTAHLSDGFRGGYFQTIEGVCPFEVVMHGHERDWPWEEGTCQYLEEGTWHVTSEDAHEAAMTPVEEPSFSL